MSLFSLLNQGKDAILDVLFPVFCVDCGKEGVWLCETCKKQIPFLPYPIKHELKYVDDLFLAFDYKHVEELIKTMKFKEIPGIAPLLADMMKEYLRPLYQPDMLFTFVPMHSLRQRWRGFNQAELLAQELAKQMQGKCITLLKKCKHTPPQSGLPAKYRKRNVVGSYQMRTQENVAGKHILLVDDVFTTGATMDACAQVLKQSGALQVIGCAVAQGGTFA